MAYYYSETIYYVLHTQDLFFPNYLGHLSTDKEKSEYVGDELIRRAIPPSD